jgi:hypothetical protein
MIERNAWAPFLLALAWLLAACTPAAMEAIPTASATLTTTATPTIQWFPATRTPTALVTVPVLPTPEQRPGVGELLLQDDFSNAENWQIMRNENGSAAIANQEMTIAISSPEGQMSSLRLSPVLDDFYMEITASPSLCRQADSYGIIARATGDPVYYRFVVSCGGLVRLERVKFGEYTILLDWMPSGQVPAGAPTSLRLGVWALGEEMRFFVDGVYQFNTTGVNPLDGLIGVFARSGGENAVTVSFSELEVYSLNQAALPSFFARPVSTPQVWQD